MELLFYVFFVFFFFVVVSSACFVVHSNNTSTKNKKNISEQFVNSADYEWKYYYNRPDSSEKVTVDEDVGWNELPCYNDPDKSTIYREQVKKTESGHELGPERIPDLTNSIQRKRCCDENNDYNMVYDDPTMNSTKWDNNLFCGTKTRYKQKGNQDCHGDDTIEQQPKTNGDCCDSFDNVNPTYTIGSYNGELASIDESEFQNPSRSDFCEQTYFKKKTRRPCKDLYGNDDATEQLLGERKNQISCEKPCEVQKLSEFDSCPSYCKSSDAELTKTRNWMVISAQVGTDSRHTCQNDYISKGGTGVFSKTSQNEIHEETMECPDKPICDSKTGDGECRRSDPNSCPPSGVAPGKMYYKYHTPTGESSEQRPFEDCSLNCEFDCQISLYEDWSECALQRPCGISDHDTRTGIQTKRWRIDHTNKHGGKSCQEVFDNQHKSQDSQYANFEHVQSGNVLPENRSCSVTCVPDCSTLQQTTTYLANGQTYNNITDVPCGSTCAELNVTKRTSPTDPSINCRGIRNSDVNVKKNCALNCLTTKQFHIRSDGKYLKANYGSLRGNPKTPKLCEWNSRKNARDGTVVLIKTWSHLHHYEIRFLFRARGLACGRDYEKRLMYFIGGSAPNSSGDVKTSWTLDRHKNYGSETRRLEIVEADDGDGYYILHKSGTVTRYLKKPGSDRYTRTTRDINQAARVHFEEVDYCNQYFYVNETPNTDSIDCNRCRGDNRYRHVFAPCSRCN